MRAHAKLLFFFGTVTVIMVLIAPVLAQLPPPTDDQANNFKSQKHYSPYAGRNFPTQVYWGDTHLHTSQSMDAGSFGARLLPEDAVK